MPPGNSKIFTDAPPAKAPDYQNIVARAKARASTQGPPPLQDTPSFENMEPVRPPLPPAKNLLSSATVEGLEALGQAQQRSAPPSAPAATVAPPHTPTIPSFARDEFVQDPDDVPEESADTAKMAKLRAAVEARCSEINLYQYLSTGSAVQKIVIIPGQLTTKMRTPSEYEEGWVDTQLALASQKPMSPRQVQRLLNELGLAVAILEFNEVATGFPIAVNPDGTVIPEAMTVRLASVRRFSSPIFALLVTNLGWFMERVNNALTAACLKNG